MYLDTSSLSRGCTSTEMLCVPVVYFCLYYWVRASLNAARAIADMFDDGRKAPHWLRTTVLR
eukprot:1461553-Pleurochrysis_carterae.AAC.1